MNQDSEFTGKIVLVTGASQGIGLEICRQFAELGAIVIMVARNLEKLEAARDSIPNNSDVHLFSCDLSVESEIVDLFSKVRERFQQIDVLIKNIGDEHPECLFLHGKSG